MSMRELAVFIEQLPMTAATKQRLMGNDSGRYWDEKSHMLADLIELTQSMVRLFRAANFKGQPPPFVEVDRPTFGEVDGPAPRFDPVTVDYLNTYC